MIRQINYKVCAWNSLQEREETIFASPDFMVARKFVEEYDGGEKEVYLKTVWIMSPKERT